MTAKDWDEDGLYDSKCTKCNSIFTGNKRSTLCKECFKDMWISLKEHKLKDKIEEDLRVKMDNFLFGPYVIIKEEEEE